MPDDSLAANGPIRKTFSDHWTTSAQDADQLLAKCPSRAPIAADVTMRVRP
jgi:hypothetical protein